MRQCDQAVVAVVIVELVETTTVTIIVILFYHMYKCTIYDSYAINRSQEITLALSDLPSCDTLKPLIRNRVQIWCHYHHYDYVHGCLGRGLECMFGGAKPLPRTSPQRPCMVYLSEDTDMNYAFGFLLGLCSMDRTNAKSKRRN